LKKQYSPISVRVEVANQFRQMAQSMNQENTEALQIVMVAYDVINNSNSGARFTDAVYKAFAEIAKVE